MEQEFREIVRQEAEKIFSEKFASIKQDKPEFISAKKFQADYGVSAPTLYRHVNAGHLSLVKFGGKSFLKRKEVESLFVTVK